MKYNELTLTKHRKPNRVGRGISANQGKTAGRGTKGQKSRTGSSKKPGFEGGQNPLLQRLPKLRGFSSKKPIVEVVYTGQINDLKDKSVNNQSLHDAGLVSSPYVKAKLILNGELTRAVKVELQGASKSASAMVVKAGGEFRSVEQIPRPKNSVSAK
ncbi:MAG TPA: 50S ribosomal protein L15 [Candidatus Saccharimonadales bacterium]|nr:50S ribosomal protein L15 [Candidatus Saccharimonadales bacterium]